MRILIVGAGAVGGYFGGRLVQSGADVTFLVRERREKQLASTGLVIKSVTGDFSTPASTVRTDTITAPYDVIVLSCKAYDLDGAIASLAPAVGPDSIVVPLLNGMRHLDVLNDRFGREHVFGGLCAVSATLNPAGHILHLSDGHVMMFGEQDGGISPRAAAIAALFAKATFKSVASETVIQDMWEKWVFLSTLASATCLMRANVGEIIVGGGQDAILGLYEEARTVAAANGHAQRPQAYEQRKADLTNPDSTLAASMLRDLEQGGRVEADHVIGDLLARGRKSGLDLPLLGLAYVHLKAFQARQARRGA